MLVAAFFVITMIVWMNRVARHLKKDIEKKVENYAKRAGSAAGWGMFLFVFLMVLREGAELALILRAVEMSSEGLQTWIGTARRNCRGCSGRFIFLQRHVARAAAPIFRGHQRDSHAGGLSAGAHRPARIERISMAAVQQNGNGHHRPGGAQRIVLLRFDFWGRRAAGASRMAERFPFQGRERSRRRSGKTLAGIAESPPAHLDDCRRHSMPGGHHGAHGGFHLCARQFRAAILNAGFRSGPGSPRATVASGRRKASSIHRQRRLRNRCVSW